MFYVFNISSTFALVLDGGICIQPKRFVNTCGMVLEESKSWSQKCIECLYQPMTLHKWWWFWDFLVIIFCFSLFKSMAKFYKEKLFYYNTGVLKIICSEKFHKVYNKTPAA